MTKARKQAHFRRRVAITFFIFLLVNVVMKVTGFSTLDPSQAVTASHAFGMKVAYFLLPSFFLFMAVLFMYLSRRKSAQAESIEISGCSW